jgi:dTDP-4-amino-4,6-dideoxygalactose transaminase
MTFATKPVSVPFRPSTVGDEEGHSVADVARSDWLTKWARTLSFEHAFVQHVGARHVVAPSSWTALLYLAHEAFGLHRTDSKAQLRPR